jgi:hypothetical protein
VKPNEFGLEMPVAPDPDAPVLSEDQKHEIELKLAEYWKQISPSEEVESISKEEALVMLQKLTSDN